MGWVLGESAKRIGCSERTLRRYVSAGLLRGRRVAGGQLELSRAEETYVRDHWTLLSRLMAALRTERDVRLAVLFGSRATGEDTPTSDVDLLIVHRRSGWMVQPDLRIRLRRALGTPVDVVMLEQAEEQPSLLADVLREGRVLIDRDGLWDAVLARREQILAAGAREDEMIMAAARATLAAAGERLARRDGGPEVTGGVARASTSQVCRPRGLADAARRRLRAQARRPVDRRSSAVEGSAARSPAGFPARAR